MRLTDVFVESFPQPLEGGKLYVSMQYASAAHLCPCGCGREVVTPIRKGAWRLEFDGEGVTLFPSVGSRNLDCRSHYFIRASRIEWLPPMEEFSAGHAEKTVVKPVMQDSASSEPLEDVTWLRRLLEYLKVWRSR
jgi:hypothetical protein